MLVNVKKILKYHEVEPIVLGTSQKGQDSFIQYTFEKLGVTNKYYVEFGACDGWRMSNTAYLRVNDHWTGLLLEGDPGFTENPLINLHNRRITKDNICSIFKEFMVPNSFDFLCIDVDGCDYWMVKSILEGNYSPRVIMIETNVRFEPHESMVLKYNSDWNWNCDHTTWYGASPYAFKKLFNANDYIPVWMHLDDMIVVRKDVLQNSGYDEPDWLYVYPQSNAKLYEKISEIKKDEWIEV